MIDPNLMNGKSNQSKSDVFARVQNNAPKKDVGCSIEGIMGYDDIRHDSD